MTLAAPITVSTEFVRRMLRPMQADGLAGPDDLAAAGIDPELLDEAFSRITGEQYLVLFKVLYGRHQDETLHFFNRPLRPGSFALVASHALTSATIGDGMKRACHAINLLQDDARLSIVSAEGLCGMRMQIPAHFRPDREFICEIILSVLHRLLDWLQMGRLQPVHCELIHAHPQDARDYRALFGCDVAFGKSSAVLWFRDQVLKTPVRRDKSELRGFQSDAARNIVFLRARHDSYNQRVREFLRKSRPAWPGLSETAAALNISSSTLQRHLQAESYNFQTVKDELRRDIAISLLQTTAQPLNLIAEALGFSDSAAFQRAFKLWTGTPAGLYRRGVDR